MQDLDSSIEKPKESKTSLPEGPKIQKKTPEDLKAEQQAKTGAKLERQKMRVHQPDFKSGIDNIQRSQAVVNRGTEENLEYEAALRAANENSVESTEDSSEESPKETPPEPKGWMGRTGDMIQGWATGLFEGMKGAGGWLGAAGGWLAKNTKAIWEWVSTTAQNIWYSGLAMMGNMSLFGVKPFEQFNLSATLGRMKVQIKQLASQFSVAEAITVVGGSGTALYGEIFRKAQKAGKQGAELSAYISQEVQTRFFEYLEHARKTGKKVTVSLDDLREEMLKKLNPERESEAPSEGGKEGFGTNQNDSKVEAPVTLRNVLGQEVKIGSHTLKAEKVDGDKGGLAFTVDSKSYWVKSGSYTSQAFRDNLTAINLYSDGGVEIPSPIGSFKITKGNFEDLITQIAQKGAGKYPVKHEGVMSVELELEARV